MVFLRSTIVTYPLIFETVRWRLRPWENKYCEKFEEIVYLLQGTHFACCATKPCHVETAYRCTGNKRWRCFFDTFFRGHFVTRMVTLSHFWGPNILNLLYFAHTSECSRLCGKGMVNFDFGWKWFFPNSGPERLSTRTATNRPEQYYSSERMNSDLPNLG